VRDLAIFIEEELYLSGQWTSFPKPNCPPILPQQQSTTDPSNLPAIFPILKIFAVGGPIGIEEYKFCPISLVTIPASIHFQSQQTTTKAYSNLNK
jgi:hypothetical protein